MRPSPTAALSVDPCSCGVYAGPSACACVGHAIRHLKWVPCRAGSCQRSRQWHGLQARCLRGVGCGRSMARGQQSVCLWLQGACCLVCIGQWPSGSSQCWEAWQSKVLGVACGRAAMDYVSGLYGGGVPACKMDGMLCGLPVNNPMTMGSSVLAWGGLHQGRLLCCWLSAAPLQQHPAVLGAVTPLTCGSVWGCVACTGMLGGSVSGYSQCHPVANPWAGLKHLQGFLLLTSRHCLAAAGVTWPSANRISLSAVVFARACALGRLHGKHCL